MKVIYPEDRYLPQLGIFAVAGEEIEIPDDPIPVPDSAPNNVVESTKKSSKNETVVNDNGDPAQ